MNWDNIRFFLAVARAGSVAAAAREMAVKHTTVLRRIDQLESDMDVKLFKRLNTGYSLTTSGQKIFAEAVAMEANTLNMGRQLRGIDQKLSGSINFTLPADLREAVLPLLADFSEQHRDIQLNIIIDTQKKNLDKLECDVALRVSHSIDEHLIGRKIAEIRFAPFIAESIFSADKPNMADYAWISWSIDLNDSRLEDWLSKSFGIDKIRLRVNDVYAAKQLIVDGYAMSFLPQQLVKPQDNLHCFTDTGADYTISVWLLTHADYRGTRRIKALMDFLAEKLSSIPALQ